MVPPLKQKIGHLHLWRWLGSIHGQYLLCLTPLSLVTFVVDNSPKPVVYPSSQHFDNYSQFPRFFYSPFLQCRQYKFWTIIITKFVFFSPYSFCFDLFLHQILFIVLWIGFLVSSCQSSHMSPYSWMIMCHDYMLFQILVALYLRSPSQKVALKKKSYPIFDSLYATCFQIFFFNLILLVCINKS